MEVQYHVFTHESDEWFDDINDAKRLYDTWAKETGSARLYMEIFKGDELYSENCLEATGAFPW